MKLCRLSGHVLSESQTAPQSGSLAQSKPQLVMWGVRGILGVLQPLLPFCMSRCVLTVPRASSQKGRNWEV